MEGSVLEDLEEEMEAEAAGVSWGRVPAGSCPGPRQTLENMALHQGKVLKDMVLGCGPEAKDWASCWWRKSAHLPDQLEDPSRVTGSQSPHPHNRIPLGRNFLE